jgi:predicted TIM-barrel fold metal-dependent hydrolase
VKGRRREGGAVSPTARGMSVYQIFSVDDHIIEPPNVWLTRLPKRYAGEAPHVVEADGREYWEYEGFRHLTMGLNAVAGLPRSQWHTEPQRFSDMIPGSYDPKARAKDFLSQGVVASISFPTLPRFGGLLFNSFKDKLLADLCVRAWNDFVLEEWCPGGPDGMYVPAIICQVWDPPSAVGEIERCIDLGARTLCFPENPVPDGLPSFHHPDFWDPIWAVCEAGGIPLSMHTGSSGSIPNIDPMAPRCHQQVIGEVATMLAMANLLISPVFDRFPDLKVVFSEGGVGWVSTFLQRADRQLDRNYAWIGTKAKPTETFERNMWVCMVEEPLGLKIASTNIGAAKILAETDYPHADCPFPDTQASFAAVFESIPADVVHAVSHGNAARLFRWSTVDISNLSSPEVESWRRELRSDPLAAMKQRADVQGVRTAIRNGPDSECRALVASSVNGFSPCGRPVDGDGVCSVGHIRPAENVVCAPAVKPGSESSM